MTYADDLIPKRDMVGWYAARNITGLNNGDAVTTVNDLSGNGRNLSCASSKPT